MGILKTRGIGGEIEMRLLAPKRNDPAMRVVRKTSGWAECATRGRVLGAKDARGCGPPLRFATPSAKGSDGRGVGSTSGQIRATWSPLGRVWDPIKPL